MSDYLAFCDPDRLQEDYVDEFLAAKRVPQNLFYLLNGATSFYSYRNADLAQIAWQDEYRFFRRQPFWSPSQRLAFISLGCGNAGPEKPLLQRMCAEACQVHYIGVDSSQAMLDLAADNLKDVALPRTYVLADFIQADFPDRLHDVVTAAQVRIYAMMGGTFGNFDQDTIADLLTRLAEPGDYLYLDVVPLHADEEDNRRLRARLSQLPSNLSLFFDRLLGSLGLSREDGELYGVESDDGPLNTIRYTFYFRASHTMTLSCLGREGVLTPDDPVELMSIRAYDVDSLKAFLGTRGFRLSDTYVPDVGNLGHLWQRLLFVREG